VSNILKIRGDHITGGISRQASVLVHDPRAEDPSVDRPFVEEAALDPDGNHFDLSTGMRDIETERAKRRALGIQ